jgi:hypothetical protein
MSGEEEQYSPEVFGEEDGTSASSEPDSTASEEDGISPKYQAEVSRFGLARLRWNALDITEHLSNIPLDFPINHEAPHNRPAFTERLGFHTSDYTDRIYTKKGVLHVVYNTTASS